MYLFMNYEKLAVPLTFNNKYRPITKLNHPLYNQKPYNLFLYQPRTQANYNTIIDPLIASYKIYHIEQIKVQT